MPCRYLGTVERGLVKKGELNHAEEILLRITGSGSVACYVKNLLLGLIRARAGNLCEAACCFLLAVDVFGDRGNNASRKYVAGALALLGMKKEANYFLTQKTLDKMIILKTIRTIEENKNKGINQETGAINDGQSFLMIRNKLGTIDSRQARKEIKNDGSFRGVKMNLCLECAKANVCPGQLPCKLSWNRQGWYCPFGFVPTSPPTPYEG